MNNVPSTETIPSSETINKIYCSMSRNRQESTACWNNEPALLTSLKVLMLTKTNIKTTRLNESMTIQPATLLNYKTIIRGMLLHWGWVHGRCVLDIPCRLYIGVEITFAQYANNSSRKMSMWICAIQRERQSHLCKKQLLLIFLASQSRSIGLWRLR